MTAKAIDVSPRFFLYVYVLSLCLIGGYLSCSVYNFLWIVHPSVGTLSAFLEGCNRQTDSYTDNSKEANNEAMCCCCCSGDSMRSFSCFVGFCNAILP